MASCLGKKDPWSLKDELHRFTIGVYIRANGPLGTICQGGRATAVSVIPVGLTYPASRVFAPEEVETEYTRAGRMKQYKRVTG